MDKAKPIILKVNGKIIPNSYTGNGVYIITGYPKTSRKTNKLEFLNGASGIIKDWIKKRKRRK